MSEVVFHHMCSTGLILLRRVLSRNQTHLLITRSSDLSLPLPEAPRPRVGGRHFTRPLPSSFSGHAAAICSSWLISLVSDFTTRRQKPAAGLRGSPFGDSADGLAGVPETGLDRELRWPAVSGRRTGLLSAARRDSSAARPVCRLPFAVCCVLPTIHRSQSDVHSPSTVHRPLSPSVFHRLPFTVCIQSSPSTVHRSPSTVHRPQSSTVHRPQPVHRPQSVHRPPSSTVPAR